ncbi:MAG TPA: hypothetical protein VGG62_13105 [Terracidiphilus sp.]|jgi:hypothetical protein
MHKNIIVCCLLLLAPALTVHARAQDTAKAPEAAKAPETKAHYYRLEFVIQELGSDNKPTNSRTYSTTVSTGRTDHYGAIRTGSRVPIITGALHGPTGTSESKLEFQYQYLDVGVSIDTENVHENDGQLSMLVKAEVSALADPTHSSPSELPNDPVIHQNSWQASVLIPIGKRTVVFSSDALENKGGMQLSITATRLD